MRWSNKSRAHALTPRGVLGKTRPAGGAHTLPEPAAVPRPAGMPDDPLSGLRLDPDDLQRPPVAGHMRRAVAAAGTLILLGTRTPDASPELRPPRDPPTDPTRSTTFANHTVAVDPPA